MEGSQLNEKQKRKVFQAKTEPSAKVVRPE